MFSGAKTLQLILGLVIGLSIGASAVYAYYGGSVVDLQARLEEQKTLNNQRTAERLEVQSSLSKAIESLSAKDKELSSARADLEKVRQELDSLTKKLSAIESSRKGLENAIDTLTKDRKLLISLRGDSGETRQSNGQYWIEMRSLAGEVSSSLAVVIDAIVSRVSNVFDLIDKRPAATASCTETLTWQNEVLLASVELGRKIDQFLDEFYLIVTEHIAKVSYLVEV